MHSYSSGGIGRATGRGVTAILAALVLAACSTDKLTQVETPDQITPEQAESAVGAASLRASALGNFAAFYGGDYGGSFHGLTITSGMLTDEIESARGGTEHLDSRAQNEGVQPLSTTWAFVGQSTTQTVRARTAMSHAPPLPGRRTRGLSYGPITVVLMFPRRSICAAPRKPTSISPPCR